MIADALDAVGMRHAVMEATPEVVINQLTNIPRRLNPRRIKEEMGATNRLRIEATRTLVEAAQAAGAHRVIAQSISFVYDPKGAAPATEDEPLYHGARLAPPISLDSRLAKTAGPERKGRDGPEAEGEQGDRRS